MNVPNIVETLRRGVWETFQRNVSMGFLVLAALLVTVLVYQFPTAPTIDVGSGRDTPFVQGFSFRENDADGMNFRWSGAVSEIRFWGVGAQDGALKLRLAVPEQNRASGAQIWVNSRNLGSLAPMNGFQEFTLAPITRDDIGWSGNLVVRSVSSTFNAPPDPRELGVQIDRAQFVGNGAPVIPAARALFFIPALTVLVFFIGRAWTDKRTIGWLASSAVLIGAAGGLVRARVETAYFSEPLFWFALILFLTSLAFVAILQRFTNVLGAPALSTRTLRMLFLIMAAALAFRMIFASGPGYIVDVQDYVVWSYKTVTYGLGTMYSALNGLWISDQSPGLNYVLHTMGLVYRGIFSPDFLYPAIAGDPALRGISDNPALLADPVQRTLLRLPMLFADILTGALIFVAARKYISQRGAWLAAFGFWFNPAVLWNGAYWGQTDAIHTLLVLVCFLLIIFTRRVGLAFFLLGLAAFTKPQAMIFGPLLLLAAYKRCEESESVLGVSRAGWQAAIRAIVFGALGSAVMLLPVLLTGGMDGLLAYFGDTIGHHPILTANAHNVWWLVFQDQVDFLDTAGIFPGAPLSFRWFSIALFGIAYLITLIQARRASLEDFFGWGAFVAFAFFMLPTEIHENYGYALLPLLAIALTRDKMLIAFYIGISTTMTWNYALHDPNLYERLHLTDPHAQLAGARWFNSLINLIVFGGWVLYLFARQSLPLPNARAWNALGHR